MIFCVLKKGGLQFFSAVTWGRVIIFHAIIQYKIFYTEVSLKIPCLLFYKI